MALRDALEPLLVFLRFSYSPSARLQDVLPSVRNLEKTFEVLKSLTKKSQVLGRISTSVFDDMLQSMRIRLYGPVTSHVRVVHV